MLGIAKLLKVTAREVSFTHSLVLINTIAEPAVDATTPAGIDDKLRRAFYNLTRFNCPREIELLSREKFGLRDKPISYLGPALKSEKHLRNQELPYGREFSKWLCSQREMRKETRKAPQCIDVRDFRSV
jgi:hypothetical protein